MVETAEVVVGIVVLVGLAGILVPVLPGSILIGGAVLFWAVQEGSGRAWAVFAIAASLLLVGVVVKYAVPGRSLRAAGVPNRSLLAGGALGIVGFFVVPVVGLFLGFVLGVYVAERRRVGAELAWPSTRAALKAVGASILIELAAGLLAASAWLAGAIAT